MKQRNRMICMLLAVIMVFCMLPVSVFATGEEPTYPVQIFTTVGGAGTTTSDGGSVSGGGDYNAGATVELTATLNEGFCAVGWVARGNEGAVIDDVTVPSDISPEHKTISFTMPAHEVEITADFRAHDYEYSYRDNEDGTHTNVCRYCKIENGVAEDHVDAHGGGDGVTTLPDDYCDKCSADLHQTYTLTFNYFDTTDDGILIGGGIADKTVEAKVGEVVDLSEYWPDELTYELGDTTYCFAGFTKKDDIKILDSVAVDSNIVLEAAWVTQEKITVTFETQGGDLFGGTRKSRVNKGCDFGTLNGFYIPTRENYVFTGWCLKSIGLPENDLTKLTEDTTVYAIWQWNRQPESAWWSTNVKGKAEWTPVDGIDGYIVTLYEAESGRGIDSKIVSGNVTDYTFNNPVIFDETKSFYFTVQACLENLKSYETKSDESKPFTITGIDGAIDSTVTVIKADGEISVPVKVINQGGSRVALTDDVFAFIGKKIDVPVADADKLAISKTAIKANLGIAGEDAEITLNDAKIILADWREIINTAEGEEQIKSLLPDYSIYELALLIQANNIIGPDDDTEEKLNRLINDEREKKKNLAGKTQISFGETKVAMDAEALLSIEKALSDGEYVAISAEKIDVTGLADDDVLFDSGVLTGSVIFTEQELLDLKVIEEDNDEITWNELKYLYHYMTITELKSLGWFIEDFLYNTDPQVLVWLAEMIERDTIKPLNMQELMDMADLTDEQWELLADADLNDPTIGELRQAGLTVEQMRRLYGEVGNLILGLNDNEKSRECNQLLDWLDDAIAAKEWEADKSQTQPTWAYTAKETVIGGVNIDFVAVKANEPFADTDGITHYSVFIAEGIFTYNELLEFGVFGESDESISWHDMKFLYHHMTKEDLRKLYHRFSGGSKDLQPFVDWLAEMIERDEQTLDENAIDLEETDIIDKLEAVGYTGGDVKLVLLRSAGLSLEQLQFIKNEIEKTAYPDIWDWINEAIAAKNWQPKTPIVASGELAYTIPVNSNFDLSKGTVRAYKVADDGSLNIKKVVVNGNGHKYAATYTPEDTLNYKVAQGFITVNGADVTAPTGTVTIGENSWNTLLNDITFGLFFKETQTVTVTAEDDESGITVTEYYLATEKTDDFTDVEWTAFEGSFDINPNNKYVVYIRITNGAGYRTIINSDGVVLDKIVPAISGIENGKDVYGDATFTVDEENLDTVTVDGNHVDQVDGKYTIAADNKEHTVVVTDLSGNSTEYKLTVYKTYTVTFVADGKKIATQVVGHGKDAELPEIPAKDGYTAKWNADGKNITADTTIIAEYTEIPKTDSPQTGDNVQMWLWFGLMLASGFALAGTQAYVRKRRK